MSLDVEDRVARLPRDLTPGQRVHLPRASVNEEIPNTAYKVVEVVGTFKHGPSKAIARDAVPAGTPDHDRRPRTDLDQRPAARTNGRRGWDDDDDQRHKTRHGSGIFAIFD